MLRNCFYANIFSSNLAEAGDLLDDVLVGVLEPLVEGDPAASSVSPDESFTIAPHPDAMAARDGRVYYCSKESTPALVGVNRIWVLPEHRRKHVATRLLDSVRATLIYGTIVEKDQIAFTDPTPDGRRLASRYTEREDFLVYNL